MEKVKPFADWIYDEGFKLPLKTGSDDDIDAQKGYKKYLKAAGKQNAETTEQKEEKKMPRVKGKCYGCKRDDMKITSPHHGLCGVCQLAVKGTKTDSPERTAILEAQAEKFAGKGKMGQGRKALTPPPKKTPSKRKVESASPHEATEEKPLTVQAPLLPAHGYEEKQLKNELRDALKSVFRRKSEKIIGEERSISGRIADHPVVSVREVRIDGEPVRVPQSIPGEAGVQLFISRNSGIHIGLKCHLPRHIWNLLTVRIGGAHADL